MNPITTNINENRASEIEASSNRTAASKNHIMLDILPHLLNKVYVIRL